MRIQPERGSTHRLRKARRIALDHLRGAFGREVPCTEARSAGSHDQVDSLDEVTEDASDRIDAVLDNNRFAYDEPEVL